MHAILSLEPDRRSRILGSLITTDLPLTSQTARARKSMVKVVLFLGLILLVIAAVVLRWMATLPPDFLLPPVVHGREAPAAPSPDAPTPPRADAPPTLLVPADLRGHRAGAEERERYAMALETEADLAALARALATQARSGDADAAAALSALHRRCSYALRVPQAGPGATPDGKTAPPYLSNPNAKRCAGLGPPGELTALNLLSSAEAWRRTAAQLGHASSRLSAPLRGSGPVTAEELAMRATVVELLHAHDYRTLTDNISALAQLTHPRLLLAWQVTLCALQPQREPNPRSPIFDRCASRFAGDLTQLSPRELRALTGQQAEILQALESGLEPLWRRPDELGDAR